MAAEVSLDVYRQQSLVVDGRRHRDGSSCSSTRCCTSLVTTGAWVLKRLPAGTWARERAEAHLGGLLFDVEDQDALAAYLHRLYGRRHGAATAR